MNWVYKSMPLWQKGECRKCGVCVCCVFFRLFCLLDKKFHTYASRILCSSENPKKKGKKTAEKTEVIGHGVQKRVINEEKLRLAGCINRLLHIRPFAIKAAIWLHKFVQLYRCLYGKRANMEKAVCACVACFSDFFAC